MRPVWCGWGAVSVAAVAAVCGGRLAWARLGGLRHDRELDWPCWCITDCILLGYWFRIWWAR